MHKKIVLISCFYIYLPVPQMRSQLKSQTKNSKVTMSIRPVFGVSIILNYINICVCVCVCVYTIYTLTGHFIRYTLLVLGWPPFCLQDCLNSLWHRFNKVLKTFLRDVSPYWPDSITQLLQICRLHIHDVNLPFHHIPKVLYWIEIWWLWRVFE